MVPIKSPVPPRQHFQSHLGAGRGEPGWVQGVGSLHVATQALGSHPDTSWVVNTVVLGSAWQMSTCHLGTKYSPYTKPSLPENLQGWLNWLELPQREALLKQIENRLRPTILGCQGSELDNGFFFFLPATQYCGPWSLINPSAWLLKVLRSGSV